MKDSSRQRSHIDGLARGERVAFGECRDERLSRDDQLLQRRVVKGLVEEADVEPSFVQRADEVVGRHLAQVQDDVSPSPARDRAGPRSQLRRLVYQALID